MFSGFALSSSVKMVFEDHDEFEEDVTNLPHSSVGGDEVNADGPVEEVLPIAEPVDVVVDVESHVFDDVSGKDWVEGDSSAVYEDHRVGVCCPMNGRIYVYLCL